MSKMYNSCAHVRACMCGVCVCVCMCIQVHVHMCVLIRTRGQLQELFLRSCSPCFLRQCLLVWAAVQHPAHSQTPLYLPPQH